MPEGTTVPCAKSRTVTLALEELDPIPGIIHEFEQLNFADIDPHGNKHNLNDTDFEWNFLGNYKGNFNVQTSTGLYWHDI